MRRLIGLLAICCLLVFPVSCKKKRKREPVNTADAGGMLATMVNVADPAAAVQLVKGFYPVENDAWRWTSGSFSATLHPPKAAAQKGARLVLKFAIPDLVLAKLHSMTMTARVNGLDLPPEEYTQPGQHSYERDVPPSAMSGDAINVDFKLDKSLPPSATDQRELGVIVSAVGFEAK
jgi:hypothetical protein